jgi:hypothetical protein
MRRQPCPSQVTQIQHYGVQGLEPQVVLGIWLLQQVTTVLHWLILLERRTGKTNFLKKGQLNSIAGGNKTSKRMPVIRIQEKVKATGD